MSIGFRLGTVHQDDPRASEVSVYVFGGPASLSCHIQKPTNHFTQVQPRKLQLAQAQPLKPLVVQREPLSNQSYVK